MSETKTGPIEQALIDAFNRDSITAAWYFYEGARAEIIAAARRQAFEEAAQIAGDCELRSEAERDDATRAQDRTRSTACNVATSVAAQIKHEIENKK